MNHKDDLLWTLFENHLFSAALNDENIETLADNVVSSYISELQFNGNLIPFHMKHTIIEEIKEDVIEMARKKTYGHCSLKSYLASEESKKKKST